MSQNDPRFIEWVNTLMSETDPHMFAGNEGNDGDWVAFRNAFPTFSPSQELLNAADAIQPGADDNETNFAIVRSELSKLIQGSSSMRANAEQTRNNNLSSTARNSPSQNPSKGIPVRHRDLTTFSSTAPEEKKKQCGCKCGGKCGGNCKCKKKAA